MELLRRIFGLEPADATTQEVATKPSPKPKPTDMDGPTAPLAAKNAVDKATAEAVIETLDNASDDEEFSDDGHTRKLPDLETVATEPNQGRRVIFGAKSDVGQVRNNNQDAIFSLLTSSTSAEEPPEVGIFIVADGMGGHHDGEKASALTTRIVARNIINDMYIPLLEQLEPDADRPTISEVLRLAIQTANEEVAKQVPEGGTTVTAVTMMGDLAYIGHVGDSRAYLITGDGIEQLTRDHSLVQRLIELEQLTPEEAAEHPQRNVLYRAIGQAETIDVDAITRRLLPNNRLIICSDGLWNLVADDEILNAVKSSASPQQACETLVNLANDRGGSDNISVIIIKRPD